MKQTPPIGTEHEFALTVTNDLAIQFDKMEPVLSTPNLVGLLERAGREALTPFLDDGESSVGITVDLQHFAPTPVGETVTCRAKVINTAGKTISFQIEARDRHEAIARGVHKRRVVSVEGFRRAVERKKG